MQDYSQILNARGWAFPVARHNFIESNDTDYHARVETALGVICRPDYPPGMILWLETADSDLYDRLTCRLPNLISGLWNAHAPLNEFQTVVDEWLNSHERACTLFRDSGIA